MLHRDLTPLVFYDESIFFLNKYDMKSLANSFNCFCVILFIKIKSNPLDIVD